MCLSTVCLPLDVTDVIVYDLYSESESEFNKISIYSNGLNYLCYKS